jgi:hypothetical protein
MKRLLSPMTNSAGLTSAGMAIYAAVVVIWNASHSHGVVSVPVIVAAVAAVAALYTRQKVTPVSDPRDGNGNPLLTTVPGTRLVIDQPGLPPSVPKLGAPPAAPPAPPKGM